MHRQVAPSLQALDRRLARLEGIELLLQGRDIANLDVKLLNLGLDELVAPLLGLDLHLVKTVDQRRRQQAHPHRKPEVDEKLLALFLACDFAVWQ